MADDPNTISTSSLPEPVSPLRQRMIDDMTIRRLAPRTQAAYLRAVSSFSRHFGRSPDRLSYEDVRAWQLHLVQSGLGASAVNNQITALRFFFRVTLGQRDASQMIPQARQPERLREVLRPDEVARLGLGDDPPPPHPRHCSWRRPLRGWDAMDRLPAQVLPARGGAIEPVPPADVRAPRSPPCQRRAPVLRAQ